MLSPITEREWRDRGAASITVATGAEHDTARNAGCALMTSQRGFFAPRSASVPSARCSATERPAHQPPHAPMRELAAYGRAQLLHRLRPRSRRSSLVRSRHTAINGRVTLVDTRAAGDDPPTQRCRAGCDKSDVFGMQPAETTGPRRPIATPRRSAATSATAASSPSASSGPAATSPATAPPPSPIANSRPPHPLSARQIRRQPPQGPPNPQST